jgi:hypothetical protein
MYILSVVRGVGLVGAATGNNCCQGIGSLFLFSFYTYTRRRRQHHHRSPRVAAMPGETKKEKTCF